MIPASRRRFLTVAMGSAGMLAAGGLAAHLPLAPAPTGKRVSQRSARALGTTISIAVVHHSTARGQSAISAAFAEVERAESIMSIYRPDSQLSQLNRAGHIERPHPYLVDVLRHALAVSRHSDGAFDVTVQPLWQAYAAAQRQGRLPTADQIAAAQALVDWTQVELSAERVRFRKPGMAITLNGIAQGFATDRALHALRQHAIEHALIDIGELTALGSDAAGERWTAGIQHPRVPDAYVAVARLDGRALATSGDYTTAFDVDFRSNHIFDPRTGCSPTDFASVTVVAPSTTAADALSTACFVLSPPAALELIRTTAGVDAFFVLKNGRTLATPGFPTIA